MVYDTNNGLEQMNLDDTLKSFYYLNQNIDIDLTPSFYSSSDDFKRKNNSDMLIISLNCCSLLSKLDDIKLFLDTFGDNLTDIIALQEIFNFQNFNVPCIKGYNVFYKTRKLNKGGGVGIFVREDFLVQQLQFPFVDNVVESLCLKVTKDSNSFIICNFYRPPSANVESSMNIISDIFSTLTNLNMPSFIACDSNINILKNNSATLLEEAMGSGFINHINIATRIGSLSASGIDQIFSNCPDKINKSGTFIESPSDHFWTYKCIDLKIPAKEEFSPLKILIGLGNS